MLKTNLDKLQVDLQDTCQLKPEISQSTETENTLTILTRHTKSRLLLNTISVYISNFHASTCSIQAKLMLIYTDFTMFTYIIFTIYHVHI